MQPMNVEQHAVLECILHAVRNDISLCFLVQARTGCGKTFIIDTIYQTLRAEDPLGS